jgi:polyhydroxyalkanoate synthesis repressor PhaR
VTQPKLIKRYQNRKLYDTQSSQYVTLDDIATMIKNGEDVKVIDNRTKDDMTNITLAQIIYEEEKKKNSILPLDALKKVIRSSGEGLTDLYERVIQPGLTQIHSAREDFEKLVGRLMKRGELGEEEGNSILKEIKQSKSLMQKPFAQFFELVRSVVALGKQVSVLEKQVESLEKDVSRLKKKGVIGK